MMKRGEIYYADLNATGGAEITKKRPVLIVSNDANNRAASTVTILPITSNITKIYPFEVAISPEHSGLAKASKIQCQQIRTISKLRIKGNAIGRIAKNILNEVELGIKIHLDFI